MAKLIGEMESDDDFHTTINKKLHLGKLKKASIWNFHLMANTFVLVDLLEVHT